MINDFIDSLFGAIARQEGEFSATPDIPILRKNPLDLRYAGQLHARCPRCGADCGAIPKTCKGEPVHDIAEFDEIEHGICAGYRQLWVYIDMDYTLQQLIYAWAPPNENNSAQYLSNVSKWTGLQPDLVLKTQVVVKLPTLQSSIDLRRCAGPDPAMAGKVAFYGIDDSGTEFGIVYPNALAALAAATELHQQALNWVKEEKHV